VSPAPVKATNDDILAAARAIVARAGAENLSLNAVAEMVGVRPPSLYKRFASRAALIEAVREGVLGEVASVLMAARKGRGGSAAVKAMARAYRAWAKGEPHLYRLLFAGPAVGVTAGARAATAPVLDAMRPVVGERDALSAARLFTAFLHGFVSMEIGGEFKMGGSVDVAFAFALETILRGLVRR
jgi:AcrR family transcriptional regulator